ncbi:hypothetical protein GLOIN_2v1761476 [Rhizophagus clarus]|uniref:Uncharacterized protein n=1 Tax=Rhizophagus clarus TaxID=94130 RepID=A0A8H3QGE8_9GLOM|nr:hypothetical protein GLOIN_2v1761476 [Rhizophagus clarus]
MQDNEMFLDVTYDDRFFEILRRVRKSVRIQFCFVGTSFSFLTKVLAIKHVFEIDSWTRGNLMASSLGIFGDAEYDVCRILTTGSFKNELFGWFEHVENLVVSKVNFERQVIGIPNSKCPRCFIYEEDWEHVWNCDRNTDNERSIVIEEVIKELDDFMSKETTNGKLAMIKDIIEYIKCTRSTIFSSEYALREWTRGII